MDEGKVLARIPVTKDADGFLAENMGRLALRGGDPYAISCTPKGVMEMLKRSGVEVRMLLYSGIELLNLSIVIFIVNPSQSNTT
jgi:5,10-methylene-tetrahydrofolate dehydrogenase/methenyl tetrahydrofolate cyclohydrolase